MRRSLALGGVLLAVALVVFPAGAASAVGPVPPAVDPVPMLPSMASKVSPSWSDVKAYQLLAAVQQYLKAGGTIAPITPAVPVARGAVAGAAPVAGTALTAFGVGWAVGQGGLLAYGSAVDALTGSTSTYDKMVCTSPPWYRVGNDVIMLGITPDCGGEVFNVSPSVGVGGRLSLAGHVYQYGGMVQGVGVKAYCYTHSPATPNAPAGYTRVVENAPGDTKTQTWGPGNTCAVTFQHQEWVYPGNGVPRIGFRQTATGVTTWASEYSETPGGTASRTPDCDITWPDGTHTTGTGPAYTENAGVPVSAQSLGCKSAWDAKPGGGIPLRIKVGSTDESGAKTTISDQQTGAAEYTPQQEESLKPGSGGLVLLKTVGTVLDSCNTWAADCADWWEATDEGTISDTYKCRFNGKDVDLIECGVYRNTFDTQTSTPTITDPATGTPQPWTSTPGTGNSLSPGAGLDPTGECFANGWGSVANPIEWVLVPVKCALVWAFVPRPAVVEESAGNAGEAWEGKPPAVIAGFLGGLALAPEPEGCSLAVTLFGITFNVLDNCPGSWMGPVTAISRVVVTLGMIFMVIVVVRRQVAGMVGYDNDH